MLQVAWDGGGNSRSLSDIPVSQEKLSMRSSSTSIQSQSMSSTRLGNGEFGHEKRREEGQVAPCAAK